MSREEQLKLWEALPDYIKEKSFIDIVFNQETAKYIQGIHKSVEALYIAIIESKQKHIEHLQQDLSSRMPVFIKESSHS